ncbi:50S ribosomal protein L11 methyltransferase [Alsobacter metallidurans]|uniref:50S ribosomal protein L11 methyltransferase n=1 Tax=Alsobacter metallidurans TaxID=340221 RepID=A0A917IBK9_9HYPH|nr:methyltransferase [Alsobacter metallidurans]GGH32383.1 50S ribosomal protein L11 methyltransferase [Alsobacter metallidurans]
MSQPATILDRPAFILAHTQLVPTPHAPEVRLHVATESTALWQKTEDELGAIGLPPPFWAFAWAGGQALARWLIDHPDAVRRKRVLDFASGSGLAGIAAALAGAARVEAVDIDAFALAAIGLNAAANGVAVEATCEDLVGQDRGWDVVLAGDVCYERDMAGVVTDWLEALARRGALVLVGDPGRSYLPRERLVAVATYQVKTTRDLEDAEVKRTTVWRFAEPEDA